MDLEIFTNPEAIEQFEKEWSSILGEREVKIPYVTPDWIRVWWTYFGEDREFYLLRLCEQGRSIGFCPLMREKQLGYEQFRFIGWPQASRMTLIVRLGYEETFVQQLLSHFKARTKPCLVSLHGIFTEDPSYAFLKEGFLSLPHILFTKRASITDWQETGFAAVMEEARGHRLIRDVLTRRQSLSKLCTLTYEMARPDEVESIFPLHEKRWSKKNDGNGFAKGQQKQFFGDLARQKEFGSFEVHVGLLKVGLFPIAFHYSIRCHDQIYAYRVAHDNDFCYYRPGFMTALHLLEGYQEEACHRVDFSTGEDEYKRYFTNRIEELDEFWFGNLFVYCRWLLRRKGIKDALKQRLKKYPRLLRWKRVTLGRLRYSLSLAPAKLRWKGFHQCVAHKGFWSVVASLLCKAFVGLGIWHPRLFSKNDFQRGIFPEEEISLYASTLDDLSMLNDLTCLPAKTIIDRYRRGNRVILFQEKEEEKKKSLGYGWLGDSPIQCGKRLLWGMSMRGDSCFSGIWFSPGVTDSKVAACFGALTSAYAPKGRSRLFLLIEPHKRHLISIISTFLKEGNS